MPGWGSMGDLAPSGSVRVMKVLLTGGSGFIGHHVVDHLLAETDWEIVVLDSLSYAGDISKVVELSRFDPRRVRVLWHDLRAPIPPATAGRIGAVDAMFNLASASHVPHSIDDPVPFVQNNVNVALHMLEFARQHRPALFVQFSTDEVFGPAPPGTEFREWDVHVPSNPYAASKSAQEQLATSYWRTYGLPVVITNTMNVYGERQHPEKFIPICVRQLRAGKPVPVHGERTADGWKAGSRYWLYAGDVASALVFIAERSSPARYPDVDRPDRWNLVGREELTNLEVAEHVAATMGVPLEVEWVDFHRSRPGHDRRYALDGSKLAAAGWQAGTPFPEGIRRVVEWLRTKDRRTDSSATRP
jgi:dTDP-glucose 4,6-dehydratase